MKKIYFVWLLSFAIFPFFQGGYFYFEALGFGLIQCLCLLILYQNQTISLSFKGFRLYYIIIIGCALLSSFSSIDIGMHSIGLLKLMVPILFIIAYDSFKLACQQQKIDILREMAHITIIAGTIMAICVIFSVAFLPMDNPLIAYLVQKNRIGGFIQYANTFAVYLFIVCVITHYVLKPSIIKMVTIGILCCGMYITQSRGTLFLFGMYVIFSIVMDFVRRKSRKSGVLIFSIIIMGSVIGQLVLKLSDLGFNQGRTMTISLHQSEWLTRVLYYMDSTTLLMNNPLGYGHLGYYYVQRSIQTGSAYLVKYVHSSILQMGLDYGIAAMLAFILFGSYGSLMEGRIVYKQWIASQRIRHSIKQSIKQPIDQSVMQSVDQSLLQSVDQSAKSNLLFAIGLFLVFVHTWIDFDAEYSVILLLVVIGQLMLEENHQGADIPILRSIISIRRPEGVIRFKLGVACLMIFSCLFGYFTYATYLEYSDRSVEAYKLYPLYTLAVDGILENVPNNQKVTQGESQEVADGSITFLSEENKARVAAKAVARNSYYIKGVAFLAEYDYNNNKIEASLLGFKRLVELAPLWFNYLEDYAKVALEYCEKSFTEGRLTKNSEYLQNVVLLSDYLAALELSRSRNLVIKNAQDFEITQELKDIEVKGQLLYNKLQ